MSKITLTLKDKKTKVTLNKDTIILSVDIHDDFYTLYCMDNYCYEEFTVDIINDSQEADSLIKEIIENDNMEYKYDIYKEMIETFDNMYDKKEDPFYDPQNKEDITAGFEYFEKLIRYSKTNEEFENKIIDLIYKTNKYPILNMTDIDYDTICFDIPDIYINDEAMSNLFFNIETEIKEKENYCNKRKGKKKNREFYKKRQINYEKRLLNKFTSYYDIPKEDLPKVKFNYKYNVKKDKQYGNREEYKYNKVGHQKFKKDLNCKFKGEVFDDLNLYYEYKTPNTKRCYYELCKKRGNQK